MRLGIFSHVYGPLVFSFIQQILFEYLPCARHCLGLFHFFNLCLLIACFSIGLFSFFKEVLHMFWKHLLLVICFAFLFYAIFFWWIVALNFTVVRSFSLYYLLKALEFCLSNLRPYFHLKCIHIYYMRKGSIFFLFSPSGELTFLASLLDALSFTC